jgi:hypothetical protein
MEQGPPTEANSCSVSQKNSQSFTETERSLLYSQEIITSLFHELGEFNPQSPSLCLQNPF